MIEEHGFLQDPGRIRRFYEHFTSPDYEKPGDCDSAIAKVRADANDPQLAWIVSALSAMATDTVYDFGCGIGRLLGSLCSSHISASDSFQYVGIDNDPQVRALAQHVAGELGIDERCTFLSPEDWFTLPDLVPRSALVLNDVLHHLHHDLIAKLIRFLCVVAQEGTSIIVGETALFRKAEPNRVPFANSDLTRLAEELHISVYTEDAKGPGKGLPLTRGVLSVPSGDQQVLTTHQIDAALMRIFRVKMDDIKSRLELGSVDTSVATDQLAELARVNLLEVYRNVESVLLHWNDSGEFIPFTATMETPRVPRLVVSAELKAMARGNLISCVYGEYGVGKSTLMRSMLLRGFAPWYGAVATQSANKAHFVSWVRRASSIASHSEVESICRRYASDPNTSLHEIIAAVAQASVSLVIDNAHLCDPTFLYELVQACQQGSARLLLVCSRPLDDILCESVSHYTLTGLNVDEVRSWFHAIVGENCSNEEAEQAWRESRQGNPQVLKMRYLGGVNPEMPESFGSMSELDWTIISSAMLLPEGVRWEELLAVGKVEDVQVEAILERGLLQEVGEFYRPHDVVVACVLDSQQHQIHVSALREALSAYLVAKFPIAELRVKRLARKTWSDVLRLCRLMRDLGDFAGAWQYLEAVSYATYMDGEYDRLLQEIEQTQDASPSDYVAEAQPELFWLFLRKGRILKLRDYLDSSAAVVRPLYNGTNGREHLAALKELAEIERRKGNYKEAIHLFLKAVELDKQWACDRRDRLITLKQLGVTYAIFGDYELARQRLTESLDGRDPSDKYGIASCKRHLAGVIAMKLEKERTLEPILKAREAMKGWAYASSALAIFDHEHDVEGIGGSMVALCKLAQLAAVDLGWDFLPPNIKEVAHQYMPMLLTHHRNDVLRLIGEKL